MCFSMDSALLILESLKKVTSHFSGRQRVLHTGFVLRQKRAADGAVLGPMWAAWQVFGSEQRWIDADRTMAWAKHPMHCEFCLMYFVFSDFLRVHVSQVWVGLNEVGIFYLSLKHYRTFLEELHSDLLPQMRTPGPPSLWRHEFENLN